MVPTQGGDCYSTPLGWLESNEGGFQRLGRSSKHSIYYLLTHSLRDLRGFDRGWWRRACECYANVDGRGAVTGGLGAYLKIRARQSVTPEPIGSARRQIGGSLTVGVLQVI